MASVWRASAGTVGREDARTRSLGESKSRNKVSVGEPAEGSLSVVGWWSTPPVHMTTLSRTNPALPFRVAERRSAVPVRCPLPFFGVSRRTWRPAVTVGSSGWPGRRLKELPRLVTARRGWPPQPFLGRVPSSSALSVEDARLRRFKAAPACRWCARPPLKVSFLFARKLHVVVDLCLAHGELKR